MRINKINTQPSFNAVNKKYFEWAEKDYSLVENISTEWLHMLRFDVCMFKKVSPKDGIDTINAVKKHMGKTNVGLEDLLAIFNNPNP